MRQPNCLAIILTHAAYRVAVCAALPLVFAYFRWRGRREPAYRQGWRERMGLGEPVAGRPFWIHAASVGEVGLAEPLIRALHEQQPERPIIVTTFTPTGAERVQARLGDIASHRYLPLDTAGATRRFMHRIQPVQGIIIETELWPNLLRAARQADVPVLLANASISERSAGRYASPLLAPLMQSVMADIAAIGAASQAHAQRFAALGATPDKVHVTGNLKYDIHPDPQTAKQGAELRRRWQAGNRPVWVAASTHDGEEALILAAHRQLQQHCPDVLLILAPRHPQRFDAVAQLLGKDGWHYASHADNTAVDATTEVVLGNTLGDVPRFYTAADVAFVGGSLVPGIGGHNMLEAALLARPVLVGRHIKEWQEVTNELARAGGAVVVETPVDLAGQLAQWLTNPADAVQAGQNALKTAEGKQGALGDTVALVGHYGGGLARRT